MEEWVFFDAMRELVLWSSPAVFLAGVILLLSRKYKDFEILMDREYGLRKRILPKLEKNLYSFHEWCLKKHALIGLICIIYALVVFVVLRKFYSFGEVIGEIY